jgi:hypothetical protein
MAYDVPIQGGVDPAATTETLLLDGSGIAANWIVFVKATNRTAATISVRIGTDTGGGGSLGDTEYDLYDFPLPPFDSITRGPFVGTSSDDIRVYASAADVTFRYDGFEES